MSNSYPSVPILFEDNHILVVEKPVNILSQADSTQDVDMLTILKHDVKARYNKPGNVYMGLVHRLDRPVGGAMVFAKTSKAASRLSDTVRKHELDKQYVTVVHGRPASSSGSLIHYLLKDTRTNNVSAVPAHAPGAKEARLDYEVLEHKDGLSLIRIQLHTGRSHQIRVQMQTIGCPLYGDQRYGASVNKPGQQIALWSYKLAFPHPTLKEQMSFTCSPPQVYPWDMWGSLQR
ncbi:RluA family pseudouridine synthase [Paenibacillus agilis]|uniref:RNA pseudouridylate synthase n=1 Tax=Paenibacillus agilis TaxID=3020863 RepID=A0A559IZD6_9BACL|nr:RluA family pseudouridine synthase [Paenibacillus agilis]TVX92967.1 RluA family pseudouridine synthase [Paenibacillus agilis]